MNKGDFQRAKELAKKVLEENAITSPPVPISLIAKNYGLKTGEYDFGAYSTKVAGFIDIEKSVIAFNKEDAPQRQAFTIAHELGHFLLHRKEMEEKKGFEVLFRRPLGSPDPDPKEQEANCFAANLLVPEEMLKKYLAMGYADSEVANIFGVSTDVIGFRKKFISR